MKGAEIIIIDVREPSEFAGGLSNVSKHILEGMATQILLMVSINNR
jgi:rhodanese-related sulfurtransferase